MTLAVSCNNCTASQRALVILEGFSMCSAFQFYFFVLFMGFCIFVALVLTQLEVSSPLHHLIVQFFIKTKRIVSSYTLTFFVKSCFAMNVAFSLILV